MNRKRLPPLLLSGAIAIAAFAVPAHPLDTSVSANASAQAQLADNNASATLVSNATPQIDRNCLRQTGSRIVARANATRSASDRSDKRGQRCVAANGRVYSREDIERTGEIYLADALRKLDPAIY